MNNKSINHEGRLLIDGIRPARFANSPKPTQTMRGCGGFVSGNKPVSSKTQVSSSTLIRRSGVFALALLLPVVMLIGLSSVGGTASYFVDTEVSLNNILKAGSVVFNLSSFDDVAGQTAALLASDPNNPTPPSQDETNIGSEKFVVSIDPGPGASAMIYTAHANLDPGAPFGCGAIVVDAWLNAAHYTGDIAHFSVAPTSEFGAWQFFVSIPDSHTLASSAVCSGAIVFDAKLASSTDSATQAFSDTKKYTFSIQNTDTTPPLTGTQTSPSADPLPVVAAPSTPPADPALVAPPDASSTPNN